MAKLTIEKGATNVTLPIFVPDSSSSTGAGLTGLAYNTSGLTCYYLRPGSAATALSLATQTVTGAHSDGGFVEVDSTNMPGIYRLDISDAICATGVRSAVIYLHGATNMAPVKLEIDLQSALDVGSDNRVLVSANAHTSGQTIAGITGTKNTLDDLEDISQAQANAACDTALTDYDAVVPADLPANFADMTIEVTTGIVDANVQKINDVTITGDGQVGTEFSV
jgi:hypothetical protein